MAEPEFVYLLIDEDGNGIKASLDQSVVHREAHALDQSGDCTAPEHWNGCGFWEYEIKKVRLS